MGTEFMKYTHVERWGHAEVDGIEVGTCHVFPKLDGANASAWLRGGDPSFPLLCAGSRNNVLGGERTLQGFHDFVMRDQNERGPLSRFFSVHGDRYTLFGEWLVRHTFKHYRPDAWRRFYVFDAWDHVDQEWVPYGTYNPILEECGIDFIPPLSIITNPTEEQLRREVEQNTYLVADGAGPGEGVVVKNYAFTNRYGRPCFAKLVRNEFKEENRRAFGVPEKDGAYQIEAHIAEEHVTQELVAKERAKVEAAIWEGVGFEQREGILGDLDLLEASDGEERAKQLYLSTARGQLIPRLLETVFHCVVTEELWAALKKHKNATINFGTLRKFVTAEVKKNAADLF